MQTSEKKKKGKGVWVFLSVFILPLWFVLYAFIISGSLYTLYNNLLEVVGPIGMLVGLGVVGLLIYLLLLIILWKILRKMNNSPLRKTVAWLLVLGVIASYGFAGYHIFFAPVY
jgi:hypothetical protein